jgi:hypothetical protein
MPCWEWTCVLKSFFLRKYIKKHHLHVVCKAWSLLLLVCVLKVVLLQGRVVLSIEQMTSEVLGSQAIVLVCWMIQ